MEGMIPYFAVALLYAGLGAYFWRRTWHAGSYGGTAVTDKSAQALRSLAVLPPLAGHGLLLQASVFSPFGLDFGISNAISAIAWLIVATYWLVNLRYRMEAMLALALPLAAVSALLPAFLPSPHLLPHSSLPLFKLHLAISMLAYSLLSIAALHALLMALVEKRLHEKTLLATFVGMPPLLTMEHLLFQIIGAGFALLTLTLGSGILFSEELFGKPLQLSHKTIFAVISWAAFAGLLVGRHVYGWRGRTAIRWTLAGFALLLLGYLGSKFVLEVVLGRA
jgi:ABC-type uncharacterized transport system, permease component